MLDETQYFCREDGVFFEVVVKFTPEMRPAACLDDVFVVVSPFVVGAVAITLEDATEGFVFFSTENGVEAGIGTALVPINSNSVFGVVIDPELAELGFTGSGNKTPDGGFIDLDVVGLTEAGGDEFMERLQAVSKVIVPGTHEVAGELDAVGGTQFPLLAVEGARNGQGSCAFSGGVGSERFGSEAGWGD